MACMCGDYCCPSCGPAQGNWKCPICGEWASEVCEHIAEDGKDVKPEFAEEAKKCQEQQDQEERAYEAFIDEWEDYDSRLDQAKLTEEVITPIKAASILRLPGEGIEEALERVEKGGD